MTFEEKYSAIAKMCSAHLLEEESIAKTSKSGITSIYVDKHPLYSMFTFAFSNLFLADARRTYDNITRIPTRAQYVLRIRLLALHATSLVGDDCVAQIVKNQIDAIMRISGSPSRALRKALEKMYSEVSITWILVILGGMYTAEANLRAATKHQSASKQSVQRQTSL